VRFGLVKALAVLCVVAGCGQNGTPSPTSTVDASGAQTHVDPGKITRARGGLPPGYEVTDLGGPVSPVAFWGLAPGWVAEPAACGVLASPGGDDSTTKGWSASGPGGIVHDAVVERVSFDQSLLADCRQWTLTSGNTTGTVGPVDAPAIDGATTVGMSTVAKTVVEGGTETTSAASTFSAYLGDYLVFVTVVTDPGSPNPPLGQEFAANLLAETVSALRG
jgi:hypothetical protein